MNEESGIAPRTRKSAIMVCRYQCCKSRSVVRSACPKAMATTRARKRTPLVRLVRPRCRASCWTAKRPDNPRGSIPSRRSNGSTTSGSASTPPMRRNARAGASKLRLAASEKHRYPRATSRLRPRASRSKPNCQRRRGSISSLCVRPGRSSASGGRRLARQAGTQAAASDTPGPSNTARKNGSALSCIRGSAIPRNFCIR